MSDRIVSHPANDAYRENWDRIWGGPGTVNHPSHEWPNGYPRYTERTCPVCREHTYQHFAEALYMLRKLMYAQRLIEFLKVH